LYDSVRGVESTRHAATKADDHPPWDQLLKDSGRRAPPNCDRSG
jgi:hypothetical protein